MKLKDQAWKTYAFFIGIAEAAGALSGFLARKGMELYTASVVKPPLSPSPIVFPIVWALLFAAMGVGAARVYRAPESDARRRGLILFAVQLAFNFAWSIIFFRYQAYGVAFVWLVALWVLILLMTVSFRKSDAPAAWLQIPYLLWVLFAGYLNFGVWVLNRT